MVPADAPDIRDASDESFGRIESLTFRAGVLEIVALTLVALGALMIARRPRPPRSRRSKARRPAGERLIGDRRRRVGAAVASWRRCSARRDAGLDRRRWSTARSPRSRIAAAGALGRPRQPARRRTPTPSAGEGRLVAPRPLRARQATCAVGAATAEDLARGIARLPATAIRPRGRRSKSCTARWPRSRPAQYGRDGRARPAALDAALASALSAARKRRSPSTPGRDRDSRRWIARAPSRNSQA